MMEEVPLARTAMYDAVDDIEPPPFRNSIETVIEDAVLTPAVLTVRTATAISGTADRETARRRGAGSQLSYEGLKLSRELAAADPWSRGSMGSVEDADVQLLAAGTLVARGFSFLAPTGVSGQAVEILRQFGQNSTYELRDDPPPNPSLEIEAVKLAIAAGADLVLSAVPPELTEYADALAHDIAADGLPQPEAVDVDLEAEIRRLMVSHQVGSGQEIYRSSTET